MIQIKTPYGWSDFEGIRKTEDRKVITTKVNGAFLSGTPEHLIKINDDFVPLDSLPHQDTELYLDVYDILGVEKHNQYYTNGIVSHNCQFRGSQNSLLSGHVLESMVTKNPIEIHDNGLKIYKEPVAGHIYMACCDVSRGVGGDYHAMSIVDLDTKPFEVVATFRNNTMSPLLYPDLIYNVATTYNNAYVLVEINDIGEQTANVLYYDLEYENLLNTVQEKNRQVIGFGHNSKLGVRTTVPVKAIGCSNIKTMIEKEKIIVNDMDAIDEFGTFVPKGKSYEADSGAHDDMVMTLVLFAWASTQSYFVELTDKDFRQQLLDANRIQYMEDIMPFGVIENGSGEVFDGNIDDVAARETLWEGF